MNSGHHLQCAVCTLHWDSKLIPTLHDVRRLEERLTVVVGDSMKVKLLGVPAYEKGRYQRSCGSCGCGFSCGCGANIARLTSDLLQKWCCADNIVNMSFDTTASNTSPHSGLRRHPAFTGPATPLVRLPASHRRSSSETHLRRSQNRDIALNRGEPVRALAGQVELAVGRRKYPAVA